MPSSNRSQTVYIQTGNPDTMDMASADFTAMRPGELGCAFDFADRAYQIVQLDSGCTASTGVGVVAANQLAFWKDRSTYLVTNDKRFANYPVYAVGQVGYAQVDTSYRNNVAGVFRAAITAGHYCCVLQRGRNIALADDGTGTAGDLIQVDTTASSARVIGITLGSDNDWLTYGVFTTSAAANVSYASVDIPNIP